MAEAASKTSQIFAVNFAALAREIAMDILPMHQILELHRLDDTEWTKIQANPQFQQAVRDLSLEWQSAANTRERVKIKAATGLESQLEVYISDISDGSIPLAQRVEAGKFLARLGELDGSRDGMGAGGQAFAINITIGDVTRHVDVALPRVIEGSAIPMDGED